ncbi:hypothetical protein HK102_007905 [Quaeritorhiza haematococci]|nr:hypothetical protein HK102_007905 [Quaeritorhiza haematococci]
MHRFVALGDRAWSTAWKEFCAAHFRNLNPLDFREHLFKRVEDWQYAFTTFAESLAKENESLSGAGEQAAEREVKKVLTILWGGADQYGDQTWCKVQSVLALAESNRRVGADREFLAKSSQNVRRWLGTDRWRLQRRGHEDMLKAS